MAMLQTIIQEDSMPTMDSQYSHQHYRPLPVSSTPIFTNPFSVTSSAPVIEAPLPAYDNSSIPRSNGNMNDHRRYSNPYAHMGYASSQNTQNSRHMSSPAVFSQPELQPVSEGYRSDTIVTTSSGASPTSASFPPPQVTAYQHFLAVPGTYNPQTKYNSSLSTNDRRLSQPSLPSASFMGSPIPSSRPRQHSMINWPASSGISSSYYATMGPEDMDTLEAGRGILAMSQNGMRHQGSQDSYYGNHGRHHSTHSSISSTGSYVYDGAADMSSPEGTYDHVSRSLPNPNGGYMTATGEDARSMMHRFNSRPPTNSKKNHVCRVCGKTFARPSSLTTHTYSHTGQKPFKCEKEGCGKKFNVVSNLRRHYKVHKQKSK